MKEFWDERYAVGEFVYGYEPNEFFASSLGPGYKQKLLLPGEGEGRNAIYAASQGWLVHAFDQSETAAAKAVGFALNRNLRIEYEINDCAHFDITDNYYDAVGLIFLHLPPDVRKKFHTGLSHRIKKSGRIIGEFFAEQQISLNSGGPRDPSLLYTVKELQENFRDLNILLLEEKMIQIKEGEYHNGLASVIRFIGVRE